VRSCIRCPLHEHRTRTVFARGAPTAELAFVGEGPGAEEDAQGLPFVGAAGQLLDRMIAAMGYGPDEIYICNVVKCRPPSNRKPTPEEMAACAPYLHEQLALVGPRALVALGATAIRGLLELDDAGEFGPSITRLRGTWKLYRGRVPLMPTFHPAYLLRSPDKKRDVWSDLQSVMRRLGKEPAGPARGRPKG
jgi:uracil-DNA glycosylase family 4